MQQIIIQHASKDISYTHYRETVEDGVELGIIKEHVDSDTYNRIASYYGDGRVRVWGLTPGTTKKNFNAWDKINSGDIVLFIKDKMAHSSATVTLKIHNPKLAEAIWGYDNKNQTWEYIYFIDEVRHQSIPSKVLASLIGQSLGQNFLYTQVINPEVSEHVFNEFDLVSDTYQPYVDQNDYTRAIEKLGQASSLERQASILARKEQAFLRRTLFKDKKYFQCGICNKQYPVEFLITAHIKQRASCTDEEKLDVKNIVMPMCKFGCDDLYEKGYVGVDNGKVQVVMSDNLSEPVHYYLEKLSGNDCKYWHENTKVYFQWHNDRLRM